MKSYEKEDWDNMCFHELLRAISTAWAYDEDRNKVREIMKKLLTRDENNDWPLGEFREEKQKDEVLREMADDSNRCWSTAKETSPWRSPTSSERLLASHSRSWTMSSDSDKGNSFSETCTASLSGTWGSI